MVRKPDLSGSGADLYLIRANGGKLVRRVLKKSTFGRGLHSQARFESEVLSYISGRPFAPNYVSSEGNSVTYEYIEGRDIFYSADGARVGKSLAMLHKFSCAPPPKFANFSPAESFIEKSIQSGMGMLKKNPPSAPLHDYLSSLSESALAQLKKSKPSLRQGGCLVHNDLTAGNIIIDNDGNARLIDWSWAMHSDGVLDLLSYTCPIVTSWQYEHFTSPAAFSALVGAYFKELPQSRRSMLLQYCHLAIPYFAALSLWAACSMPPFPNRQSRERFSSAEFYSAAEDALRSLCSQATAFANAEE